MNKETVNKQTVNKVTLNKMTWIGIFFFTLFVGFILYWGQPRLSDWLQTRGERGHSPSADQTDAELLTEFLEGKDVDETAIYAALFRMAESSEADLDDLQKLVKQASENSSPRLRQAALRASSQRSETWAIDVLKKGLEDRDPEVRLTAIDALKSSSGEWPIQVLRNHLSSLEAKNAKDPEEKDAGVGRGETAATLSALALLSKSAAGGKLYLDRLKNLSRGDSANTLASQKLVEATQDPELLRSHLDELLKRKDLDLGLDRVAASALLKLANLQDPKLASKLEKLSHHPNALVRRAAMQSLHRVCPDNLWSLVDRALRDERDPNNLVTLIEVVSLLERPRAVETLEKFLQAPSRAQASEAQGAQDHQNLMAKTSQLLEEMRRRPPTGGACSKRP